jgi:DNA-binding HxlR family transcriptional regulator
VEAKITVDREPRTCDAALTRAFGFLGKRWNGVLLGALVHGPAGFAGLKRLVGGISDSVLSERLSELCEAGLVVRTVDAGPPIAVTYRASDSGLALMPALEALTTWAEDNLPSCPTA